MQRRGKGSWSNFKSRRTARNNVNLTPRVSHIKSKTHGGSNGRQPVTVFCHARELEKKKLEDARKKASIDSDPFVQCSAAALPPMTCQTCWHVLHRDCVSCAYSQGLGCR
eukprot:4559080-Amphidinium_carterae.1